MSQTTVTGCRRIRSSVNGNPRYELQTIDGTYRTARDTSQAYNLESTFPTGEKLNVPVRLILDGGEVIDWEVQK